MPSGWPPAFCGPEQVTITAPKKPWTETREAFWERLRAIARHINTQYRVDDLCREFPGRIQQLIDVEGDNLKK